VLQLRPHAATIRSAPACTQRTQNFTFARCGGGQILEVFFAVAHRVSVLDVRGGCQRRRRSAAVRAAMSVNAPADELIAR